MPSRKSSNNKFKSFTKSNIDMLGETDNINHKFPLLFSKQGNINFISRYYWFIDLKLFMI